MDYILSGKEADVNKVIKENRIRVQRGVIKFTPVERPAKIPEDIKGVVSEDTKIVKTEDSKDIQESESIKKRSKKS